MASIAQVAGVDAVGLINLIVAATRSATTPEELQATRRPRENDRELVGEIAIDVPEQFSGDGRAVTSAGGGAEEGALFGGELQRESCPVYACGGVERSVSVPPGPERDRSVP